jgi:hypothetical protein
MGKYHEYMGYLNNALRQACPESVKGHRANGAIQLRNSEHYAVSGEFIEPL